MIENQFKHCLPDQITATLQAQINKVQEVLEKLSLKHQTLCGGSWIEKFKVSDVKAALAF